jgi:uncharacterized protein (TIGR03083 family)
MTTDAIDPAPWLAAVQASHARLRSLVEPLSSEEVRGRAYPSEWSIAQVLSHLGSGAQIFGLFLEAGLSGSAAPGVELFHPIWDGWNAKSPQDQASDGLVADGALVDRLSNLTQEERDGWQLDMFGGSTSFAGLLRLRIGEHAVHTWDVAVALDPAATVSSDAVHLLIDDLGPLVRRSGKPHEPARLHVRTSDPSREFVLDLGETNDLRPWDDGTHDGELSVPAEGLLRLVYGRLDADHAPSLTAVNVDLDDLRTTFPGF